jgi:hypothetical protein
MPMLIGLLTNLIPTIVSFFANMAKKLTLTAIIVPIQITFLIALYVAKFAFLTTVVTLIIWLYNRVVDLTSMINALGVDSNFSLVFDFLRSIGFIQALNETFAYFSFVLVSFLLLFLSKVAISSLQLISDEYYKIGVLLQLGLK